MKLTDELSDIRPKDPLHRNASRPTKCTSIFRARSDAAHFKSDAARADHHRPLATPQLLRRWRGCRLPCGDNERAKAPAPATSNRTGSQPMASRRAPKPCRTPSAISTLPCDIDRSDAGVKAQSICALHKTVLAAVRFDSSDATLPDSPLTSSADHRATTDRR